MTDKKDDAIGPGHVCLHGIRWPWACNDCDAAPTAMQPEDGLEVVAWMDETEGAAPAAGVTTDAYAAAYWEHTSGAPMTELVRHSEAAAIITSLRAENARLRAGLKPFARMAEADDYAGTPEGASVIVNVDRLRAARQIIDQEAGK